MELEVVGLLDKYQVFPWGAVMGAKYLLNFSVCLVYGFRQPQTRSGLIDLMTTMFKLINRLSTFFRSGMWKGWRVRIGCGKESVFCTAIVKLSTILCQVEAKKKIINGDGGQTKRKVRIRRLWKCKGLWHTQHSSCQPQIEPFPDQLQHLHDDPYYKRGESCMLLNAAGNTMQ